MRIDKESFGAFFDGTPGKNWDEYAARLKNVAAGEVDDRGFSLADHILGTDENGPNGPPYPNPPISAADTRKAQNAYRKRQKESYSLLTQTMQSKTQLDYLRQHYSRSSLWIHVKIISNGAT